MMDKLDKYFDEFESPTTDEPNDICPSCEITMNIEGDMMICGSCGKIRQTDDDTGAISGSSGMVVIRSGKYARKFHSSTHDSVTSRYTYTLDLLNSLQDKSTDFKLPPGLLQTVAMEFTKIKIPDGDTQKALIKRGIPKKRVLAVMIYYIAINNYNTQYKKSLIAKWAGLDTNKFSKAEILLRDLQANGSIEMSFDDVNVSNYVKRYFGAIGISDLKYHRFAIELVEFTEDKNIGMSSLLSSKVAGSLWLVISHCKLKYSVSQVEKCTDNTKSATFKKFANLVNQYEHTIFHDIFVRHDIPFLNKL